MPETVFMEQGATAIPSVRKDPDEMAAAISAGR
jgi:hypothetical protein